MDPWLPRPFSDSESRCFYYSSAPESEARPPCPAATGPGRGSALPPFQTGRRPLPAAGHEPAWAGLLPSTQRAATVVPRTVPPKFDRHWQLAGGPGRISSDTCPRIARAISALQVAGSPDPGPAGSPESNGPVLAERSHWQFKPLDIILKSRRGGHCCA